MSALRAGVTPGKLFLLAAGCGLATGALIGCAVGLIGGVLAADIYGVGAIAGFAVAGVIYGALIAAVPSIAGAAAVALTLQLRHPQPADPDAVRRDLAIAFAAVLGILDVLVILAVFGSAEGGRYLLGVAGILLALDLVLLPVLWWIRKALTRAWTGE